MRVTNNNKPQTGLKFELHKAITFDLEEARKTGAFEKNIEIRDDRLARTAKFW
jgi:hypothetical protein